MYDIRVNRRTIVCMTREARLSCRGYDRWPARSAEPLIVAVQGSWRGGATGEGSCIMLREGENFFRHGMHISLVKSFNFEWFLLWFFVFTHFQFLV